MILNDHLTAISKTVSYIFVIVAWKSLQRLISQTNFIVSSKRNSKQVQTKRILNQYETSSKTICESNMTLICETNSKLIFDKSSKFISKQIQK